MHYTKKQIKLLDEKSFYGWEDNGCSWKITYQLLRGNNKQLGETFAVIRTDYFSDMVNEDVTYYPEKLFETLLEARNFFDNIGG
jgi:hypothetical protein